MTDREKLDENPWTVGAAVIPCEFRYGITRWGSETTIEKVYKNGNFVVSGQQYRPWSGGYAVATGDTRYSEKPDMYLATDENRAKAAAAREKDAAVARGTAIRRALDDSRLTESIGRHSDEFEALLAIVKKEAGVE